jgi:hypothetical protein
MSLVSPDNSDITNRVARVTAGYTQFQNTLRGSIAVILTGLGNGTYTMVSMNQAVETIGQDYLNAVRLQTLEDLGKIAENALKTSKADSATDVSSKALTTAETLHRGFAADVESSIELAVSRDLKTSLEFIRTQLIAGRFVATTAQLTHDVKFEVRGKMTLASEEYVRRQINFNYRSLYNSLLQFVLITRNIDEAVIDGGSHDGEKVDLMELNLDQSKIFHHNSKSLLQPLDVGI